MFIVVRKPVEKENSPYRTSVVAAFDDEIGAQLLVNILKKALYSEDWIYNVRDTGEDE